MEELIWGLLGLAIGVGYALVVPVLAIIAFQRVRALEKRVEELSLALAAAPADAFAPEPAPSPAGAEQPMETRPQPQAAALAPEQAMPEAEPATMAAAAESAEPPVIAAADSEGLTPRPASEMEPQPKGLEQRLGSRGFVWIGGLSIALAGAFLVKYSIEEGLLTETMRVILGIVLGFAILFVGDRMRLQSATIGQALTAAGVAVLYAAIFGAIYLYHLLGPTPGFVILCALTAAAIGLALRHGPFVGLVGLAGGFLTPFIVSTNEPKPFVLFSFLYLLQLGAQWLGRVRGWWYVTATGIAGGLIWAGLLVSSGATFPDGSLVGAVWLPLFLIATAATSIWLCPELALGQRSSPARIVALIGAAVASALLAFWLGRADYAAMDWAFAIIMLAAAMIEGRRHEHVDVASFAVALIVLLLGFAPWAPLLPNQIGVLPEMVELDRYLWVAVALGGLLTLGGFGLERGARDPARWAGISATGGAIVFAIVYFRLRGQDFLLPWSLLCLIMSALHLGATERLNVWRAHEPRYRGAFAVHALACAGFLAVAVPLVVEDEWLAVCWSLLLPITAWIAAKVDEPWLRRSIWVGAPAVLLAVLFSGFPAGERPIFNWLLYGIGIPAASFLLTAYLVRRAGDMRLGVALSLGGALLGFLLLTLEIRHLFHGRIYLLERLTFAEAGTLALIWCALGWIMLARASRLALPRLANAGHGLLGLSMFMTVYGVWILANPFFTENPIAGPAIFNSALYVFGGSVAVYAWVARWMLARAVPESGGYYLAMALYGFALVDGFIGMSALNRQLFQGANISFHLGPPMPDAEMYGYSLAWLVYAGMLLAGALLTKRAALRHASAGVTLIVILKVFFVDVSDLTGLYRVAAFLGLGVTLVGFGYLYQRFVLKRPA